MVLFACRASTQVLESLKFKRCVLQFTIEEKLCGKKLQGHGWLLKQLILNSILH